jgi:hypothetical protein
MAGRALVDRIERACGEFPVEGLSSSDRSLEGPRVSSATIVPIRPETLPPRGPDDRNRRWLPLPCAARARRAANDAARDRLACPGVLACRNEGRGINVNLPERAETRRTKMMRCSVALAAQNTIGHAACQECYGSWGQFERRQSEFHRERNQSNYRRWKGSIRDPATRARRLASVIRSVDVFRTSRLLREADYPREPLELSAPRPWRNSPAFPFRTSQCEAG